MSLIEAAYANGQLDALFLRKFAQPRPTHPTVRDSALLRSRGVNPSLEPSVAAGLQAPTSPDTVKRVFDMHEQSETRTDPLRKLSAFLLPVPRGKAAEERCTTCRRPRHYGPCLRPRQTRPAGEPIKAGDFNAGVTGSDPVYVSATGPSTSPHYHSATSADSALARARDGRPADEQAATGFADLFRHLGIAAPADQAVNNTGGLNKTALSRRLAGFLLPGSEGHSSHEQRGPGLTSNPYEERLTIKSPPIGWGDEGPQRIERAFDQIDGAVDSTNIDGASQPVGGPLV